MFKKVSKNKIILAAILVFTSISRLWRINYPNAYVFDEVYHAFTSKQYLLWNKAAWEWWTTPPPGVAYEWTHPPLAKEIMALSMFVLHNTDAWAWRLPGVLLGIVSVYLVYLITQKLFAKEITSLIAAFLFSLDGLNFVQSRTGMNDVYVVVFILATILYMLDKKYFISSIFLGLALASKWSGLYLFGFVLIILLLTNIKDKIIWTTMILLGIFFALLIGIGKASSLLLLLHQRLAADSFNIFMNNNIIPFLLDWRLHVLIAILLILYLIFIPGFRKIGVYLLFPPLIYVLTYIPMFLMGHDYKMFTQLQQQMWWYHTNLKATHNYASPWWAWPFNLYPVWYYVQYYTNGMKSVIFASGNPILYITGVVAILGSIWTSANKYFKSLFAILIGWLILLLVIPIFQSLLLGQKFAISNPSLAMIILFLIGAVSTLVSLWKIYKNDNRNLFISILGYIIFWLPWALSPRIMFLYHYCPSIPFLSIILAYQLTVILESPDKTILIPNSMQKRFMKNFHIKKKDLSLYNQNTLLVATILVCIFLAFILLYPVLTGLPLANDQLVLFFRSNLTKDPFGLR